MSLAKLLETPLNPALPLLMLCLFLNLNLYAANAAPAPAPHFDDNLEVAYPTSPNEVLPIEPLLIYPEQRQVYYEARTLGGGEEQDIIFVKLLADKLNGYRPKQQQLRQPSRKELGLKDIFFVKARANGQFSHERLKVYRLPEFYAINVFRNGDK